MDTDSSLGNNRSRSATRARAREPKFATGVRDGRERPPPSIPTQGASRRH